MILPAVTLAFSLLAHLSASDQSALSDLRAAVDGLERGNQGTAAFERLTPPTQIATWKRLQREIRYPIAGSQDLAFALAYYHVDFSRNIQRLLLPVRRKEQGRPVKPSILESLPLDLEILYERHPDAQILNALLDPRITRNCDADARDPGPVTEALNNLWLSDPAALLRAASGSGPRIKTLADAIDCDYGDKDPAHRRDAATLRGLSGQRDARVAAAARQLLAALRHMHGGVWPPRGVAPYAP
jgi:hypothetical protein